MKVTIRPAEKRDIPDLVRLLLQICRIHHDGRPDIFKYPAAKYGEPELEAILADPSTPVFVACGADGAVAGYAFCAVKEKKDDRLFCDLKTLYIDDLCVDESLRGQGVGRALYDRCVSFARDAGCGSLTLNVWSCNPAAVRFYEKCGMVPQKIGMETLLN